MSRHTFPPKADHSFWVVVVGWDAALASFFFQYGDPCSDLPLILATGQRSAEHPSPGIIIALAEHLGDRIPSNLLEMLYEDRQAEGAYENDGPPELVRFSTQADNGEELGFTAPRGKLTDVAVISSIADRIISGEAERLGGPKASAATV